jgi:hypothetical protein
MEQKLSITKKTALIAAIAFPVALMTFGAMFLSTKNILHTAELGRIQVLSTELLTQHCDKTSMAYEQLAKDAIEKVSSETGKITVSSDILYIYTDGQKSNRHYELAQKLSKAHDISTKECKDATESINKMKPDESFNNIVKHMF